MDFKEYVSKIDAVDLFVEDSCVLCLYSEKSIATSNLRIGVHSYPIVYGTLSPAF